jgi:pimeloyl-ACP methyl ester carboxylesterase
MERLASKNDWLESRPAAPFMKTILVAVHGIMTGQTEPGWPEKLDAWMFQRAPQVKVLKKKYRAGPFPRWNCCIKDPLLARALANELELLLKAQTSDGNAQLWFVAHSNGAIIALLTAGLLINRGYRIAGLLLTGAACEADIARNNVLEWQCRGMLDAAIAYSSGEDRVLPEMPSLEPEESAFKRFGSWVWRKLIWPYGSLGRVGWLLNGRPFARPDLDTLSGRSSGDHSVTQTRWYSGGHSRYFAPENIEATFEQIYGDVRGKSEGRNPKAEGNPNLEDRKVETRRPKVEIRMLLLSGLVFLLAGSIQIGARVSPHLSPLSNDREDVSVGTGGFEPVLAQATAPVGLAAWLACAAFVMMLANQAFRLKERLLGEKNLQQIFPQPLDVRNVRDPVTREYCDSNYHANTRRIKAIEQELAEIRSERRESAAKLEQKIESVSSEMPEMERRLNAANEARFEKVHNRINEVLGEVRELRGEFNVKRDAPSLRASARQVCET